jgi:hypothetical protein
MSQVSELKEKISEFRYNPAAIQRSVLEVLEKHNGGELELVDPSNPFVFLLEASSVLSSAAMVEAEALTRQQYSSMALTEDELYLHMSDKDYVGRFGTPSRTTFTVLLSKEELIQRAVATGNGSSRKLVIPRNTEFRVSDYTFAMQYPIEIRVMGHGGIHVVYDVSRTSPLKTIETNVVEWSMINIDRHEFIKIQIPVEQFKLKSQFAKLNKATGYSKTFEFDDQFYFCRVYRAMPNNSWEEIKTTHTDQVFDPFEATVLLKVYDDRLKVTVPHVYLTTGILDRELRIDIYSTKGPLDLILENYELNAFSAEWRDLDKDDGGKFVAPLSTMTNMAVFSDSIVVGGGNALSFDELRERVIMNGLGAPNLPITNVQLESRLSNLGYSVVKDVDHLTNRIFMASRQLPAPSNGSAHSAIGCLVTPYQATIQELLRFNSVYDNGRRLTLSPDAIYENVKGVVRILTDQEVESLEGLSPENLTRRINEASYLYTPFHYVLDTDNDLFDSRAYYLDKPGLEGRQFVNENDSLGLQVASNDVLIDRVSEGYRIRIVTRSGAVIKDLDDYRLTVQLCFRPPGELRNAYLNGELIGMKDDERIYQFIVKTDYDIDAKNRLLITNFQMFEGEHRAFPTPLLTDFDVAYFIDEWEAENARQSDIDYFGADFLLPSSARGIIHERLKVRLGWALNGLWTNSRSIISSKVYKRYQEDMPDFYKENVYDRDSVTGQIKITRNDDGSLDYNLLHKKNDPVLDSEGTQVYRHFKGDVMLGSDGQPVVEDERSVLREMDLVLLDGKYRFATDTNTLTYRRNVPNTLVRWLEDDIDQFRNWVLEQTKIYLYPQNNLGQVQVMVEEGVMRTVDLEQAFEVRFYLSREKYADGELRGALSEMAVATIAEFLSRPQVTINDIVSQLTAKAGEDIIAVDVAGLGGEENFSAMTITDESKRFSIKKRLAAMADGSLTVTDNVDVIFLRHAN